MTTAAETDPAIRPARATDIPAITAIYGHAVVHGTSSWELEPPDEAEMARRLAAVTGAGFPYLVLEEAGRVAGYAYLGAYRPRPAYRWTVENSIYVAPDAQGRGVGRRLLDALVREATAMGFRQMIAVIGDRASTASIALHAAAGFRHIGIAEALGYKHGRWLDQIQMQLTLGEGASTPPGEIGGRPGR